MEQKLVQKQAQKMLFSPIMQESMHILQMPLMDLRNLIENELENNPLIEEFNPPPPLHIRREPNESEQNRFMGMANPVTLQENLVGQLSIMGISEEDMLIAEEIIGNIDDDGYLKASVQEIAQSLNKEIGLVEKALSLVQNCEPYGVGARDLKESLLIQLGFNDRKDSLAWKIVENYLAECGKKQYLNIAKLTGATLSDVKQAVSEISKLEPKPGRKYSIYPENQYIIPDIYIRNIDGEYQIESNRFDIPLIRINPQYNSILKDKGCDQKTQDYVKEKIKSANFLIRCIRQRQETIRKIVEYFVKEQSEFIEKGRSYLKPLKFDTVAKAIGRHQSTISRAIENKYIETPAGLYAMREFFSSGISDSHSMESQKNIGHSSTSVKIEVKNIIDNENKSKPLSDQKLEKILCEKGINISRRTIAKYREELKILPTHLRKT